MINKQWVTHLKEQTQNRYNKIALRVPRTKKERQNKEIELSYADELIKMYTALLDDEFEKAEKLAQQSHLTYNSCL